MRAGNIGHNKSKHMSAVAEYMYHKASKYNINPEEAYIVGLLHDVGYLVTARHHAQTGADILSKMGLDYEYAEAIATHGINGYEIPGGIRSPMQYLLQEADMSIDCHGLNVGFHGRLKDIRNRYGEDSEAYRNAKETVRYLTENPFDKLFKETVDWEQVINESRDYYER